MEILQGQAENFVDLASTFLTDRSTSYRKARRALLHGPPSFKIDWAWQYREWQTFHSTMHRLKKQGLIEQNKHGGKSLWRITKRGLKKLIAKKKNDHDLFSTRRIHYTSSVQLGFTIVIFDIPEREKFKRRWLRESLRSLDFLLLQKSVWLSKHKLPEEFLQALRERKMLDYVHILGITKAGTLKSIL